VLEAAIWVKQVSMKKTSNENLKKDKWNTIIFYMKFNLKGDLE